ncbi:MAG: purine-nucleoside phosphorylase [Saprospiraceae bacterium]
MYNTVLEAVQYLGIRFLEIPSLALVLGTGFNPILQYVQVTSEVEFKDIPNYPALDKQGRFILGSIQGYPILILVGRMHYYEGYTMKDVAFPIRMMQLMGIKHIIFTNASGSVNPHFNSGEAIMIQDHINLMPEHPLRGANDVRFGVRFPDMIETYDRNVIEEWMMIARRLHINLKTGTYLAMQGPSLETPAEYKMAFILGADLVGMSTVPEVIVARHGGMKVTACSIVSNICYPINRLEKTDLSRIISTVEETVDKVAILLLEYCKHKISSPMPG